jgi:hypothetical protein
MGVQVKTILGVCARLLAQVSWVPPIASNERKLHVIIDDQGKHLSSESGVIALHE